jgi:hypothetical protein
MERENQQHEAPVDLGAASVVTEGPAGTPIDEVQGFLGAGLVDD